jgi:hypothetical protein
MMHRKPVKPQEAPARATAPAQASAMVMYDVSADLATITENTRGGRPGTGVAPSGAGSSSTAA